MTGLASLRSLDCFDNLLTTLEPLAGLTSLQSLHCSGNGLTTLEPLAEFASLQSLHCWDNPVERLPEKLVWQESLLVLIIPGTAFAEAPQGLPPKTSATTVWNACAPISGTLRRDSLPSDEAVGELPFPIPA